MASDGKSSNAGWKAGAAFLVAVGLASGAHSHHHASHSRGGGSALTVASTPGSGVASYQAVENAWIAAGGPRSDAATEAAIATAESGRRVGIIQQGQPYGTTGWGTWQITPGDSEPQCGTDQQLLSLRANACAAVAKYNAQGLDAWTTYRDGAFRQFLR